MRLYYKKIVMRRLSYVPCWAWICLGVVFVSCEKGRPEFGAGFIEEGEKLRVSEVVSHQFALSNDSIGYRASLLFSQTPLGQVSDPTFGKSTAHFATELVPSLLVELPFTQNSVVDSVCLRLHFIETYGKAPLRIRVSQLKDTISRADKEVQDSRYAGGLLLGETVLRPEKRALHLPLSREWGGKFLTEAKALVKERAKFRAYFPGIYVQATCDAGGDLGRMLTYHAADPRNGISFYWREGGKSHVLHLQPGYVARRYGMITFDLQGSALGEKLKMPKEEQTKQPVFYLAGQGRAIGVVDFTALREQWRDSAPASLLRAELRLPLLEPSNAYGDTLVSRISSFFKEGENYLRIPDQTINASTYHGLYSRTKGYYSLNITMFLQQLLAGNVPDNCMHLFADETFQGFGRVVLASPSHPERPTNLILTYTRL